MEKKYKFEKPEPSKVEEPAVTYPPISNPPQEEAIPPQVIEEMKENVRRGIHQIRNGEYYTTDELDDFVLR